ncbi:hypothetical protein [Anaerovorax odorimutans]|uniref:hypothetical protein n=1 Tax=Anaerovorax odorimutans TaxID=109327 RepID=UPI000425C8AD|nr:hypothetical protein [Anaerovorax odorimutans]
MIKQSTSLKFVYKIHSSRLRNANWDLKITLSEARKNDELITISDNELIRFIYNIKNYNFSEEKVENIKNKIKQIKILDTNMNNINNIKKLYSQLDEILFIPDIVNIIIDKNSDFDRANKGFFINGLKFQRLLASTGGVKSKTIIYVLVEIYNKLKERIDNGRNLNKKLIPGKLEAYQALICSASIPMINTKNILVVNDCITDFTEDIIKIDDGKGTYPIMQLEKNAKLKLNDSDGYGLISPDFSKKWSSYLGLKYEPSGYCIRNSFCKGMLFTFDFKEFARKIAKKIIAVDVWGNKYNINEIDIILTTSMLKLWDSYENLSHYISNCEKNKYNFSITKVMPEKLENERNLNYQFIQSLNLNDNDIEQLIKPTVDEIKDVLYGDYRKSILFLRGHHINENNVDIGDYNFIKALMIDKKIIEDPFVKNSIHKMIKKRINDAKIGVLKINGNFSTVSGDPYSLCQSIFNLKVTGLLKSGEFYSNYWNKLNVNKVACFRAPMTCHNNIRILDFKKNTDTEYWYRYMNTVTIFNSWDATAYALNGLDKDGDTILTTNNPIILKGITQMPAIVCMQKSAEKIIVKEEDLIKSNKNNFGNEIGTITNKITSMFDVLSKFNKDTKEYKELIYRISCGQNYQQNSIDKTKGIICKDMPKEWYDFKPNKILEKDTLNTIKEKEFNLNILADKKPYFFIYIYPDLMKNYKNYIKQTNRNSLGRFGLSINNLIEKDNKSDEEITFLDYYYTLMPVFINNSIMNKICWKIEYYFDDCIKSKIKINNFDYNLLKSHVKYSKSKYNKIYELYEEYKYNLQQFSKLAKKDRLDKSEKRIKRSLFKNTFKQKSFEICNNKFELCDIILDICYQNNNSKQFAWDIVGNIIIENLLNKNNNTYNYPSLDKNGDILFCGMRFIMKKKYITSYEEIYEYNN